MDRKKSGPFFRGKWAFLENSVLCTGDGSVWPFTEILTSKNKHTHLHPPPTHTHVGPTCIRLWGGGLTETFSWAQQRLSARPSWCFPVWKFLRTCLFEYAEPPLKNSWIRHGTPPPPWLYGYGPVMISYYSPGPIFMFSARYFYR